MQNHRRPLLLLTLAAALLLTGVATTVAQRRGARRAAARDIPNSVLSMTVPSSGFRRRQSEPAVLFNKRFRSIEDGVSEHTSSIFAFVGGRWVVPRLPSDFGQTGWVFTGRAPNRQEFWGIAEIDVAGPGPTLEIVSSRDGSNWSYYALNKISRFASFESLHMSQRGVGALTIRLTEEMASAETPAQRPGYYTYTTRNRGRTWSRRPRFSASKPPEPPGALAGADTTYNDTQPPGAARLREIMRELQQ